MTDINGTVVGLQGREVDDAAPSDGNVLTWNEGESKWQPKTKGLNKVYFTANDTWICPEGVTNILIIACGGGSGGYQGGESTPAGGYLLFPAINAIQVISSLTVIPSVEYTITIGAGGIGGIGSHYTGILDGGVGSIITFQEDPTGGESTYFSDSNGVLFSAKGAKPITNSLPDYCESLFNSINTYNNGNDGYSFIGTYYSFNGGLGGFAGPQGPGGDGGAAAISTDVSDPAVATSGSNAGDNTGAGGGQGGRCGWSDLISPSTWDWDCHAGDGGNGGSGYLYIVY